MALDHFGLLGLTQHSASWLRLCGIVVVGLGALLIAVG